MIGPEPVIEPAELIVTVSPTAVVVPVSTTSPLVTVVSVTLFAPLAVTASPPNTVRSLPPVFCRLMAPSVVVTVMKRWLPPPEPLTVIVPVPVVTVVNDAVPVAELSTVIDPLSVLTLPNVTLPATALSKSIAPVAVSAVIDPAASSRAVELPMPVSAFRSTVAAVTWPAPLMSLADVTITVSSAVVVPVSMTLPLVAPVLIVMFAVLPALSAVRLPPVARSTEPLPSRPAETVMRFSADTAALITMSSSASRVTVVGSMSASTVMPSAASRRMLPEPVNFALTSMAPVVVPAVILVFPVILTVASRVTLSELARVSPAPAVLATDTVVELSSVMLTAPPVESNSRLPKLTDPVAAIVIDPDPASRLAVPLTPSVSALSASEMLVPVIDAFPLSIVTLAPDASVTAPEDVSVRLLPVLAPVSSVDESSVMATAPVVVLNVSVPKLTEPVDATVIAPAPASKLAVPLMLSVSALSASKMLVPVIDALPLSIVTLAPDASVTPAADTSVRLSPVLVPVSSVDESSVIETASSDVLNVRLPKFTVPVDATVIAPAPPSRLAVPLTLSVSALSASAMLVPVIDAFPLSIVTLVPDASVTPAEDTSTRLSPVIVPVSSIDESSVIETAPSVVLNVRLPKFTVPVVAIVMAPAPASKLAVPLTLSVSALSASKMLVPVIDAFPLSIVTLAPDASVTPAEDTSVRLSPVLVPVSSVDESSVMATAPAVVLNVSVPKFTEPLVATVIAPAPPSKLAFPATLRVSPLSSARLMLVPVIDALPLLSIVTLVPAASVTAPVETSVSESPVFVPVS